MSPAWFARPVPDATVEITADRVSALVIDVRSGRPTVTAVATSVVRAGAVTPGFVASNIHDAAAVTAAIGDVVGRLGARVRRIALVVPDAMARVSLVRLEHLPARREDLAQLVQWQVRKGVPFAPEEARVSFVPGTSTAAGHEFLATVVRAGVLAEYEKVCADAGLQAGLVDIATTAAVNLRLSGSAPSGDWLLVHVREDACAVVVLRGDRVLFYRTRTDEDRVDVGDFVHQAVMYYQDRLEGKGFQAVYVAGGGSAEWPVDVVRQNIEARIGATALLLDPGGFVALPGAVSPVASRDVLIPLTGMALRALELAVA